MSTERETEACDLYRYLRWVMGHLWTPVGVGVKTPDEFDVLARYLCGDSRDGSRPTTSTSRSRGSPASTV